MKNFEEKKKEIDDIFANISTEELVKMADEIDAELNGVQHLNYITEDVDKENIISKSNINEDIFICENDFLEAA